MLKNEHVEEGKHTHAYCRHCGSRIEKKPYISTDNTFCTENCFLKARDTCISQKDTYTLLAETLVGALDLREHETGLHSKRVACHTLILARRFTSDLKKLQQIYWGGSIT